MAGDGQSGTFNAHDTSVAQLALAAAQTSERILQDTNTPVNLYEQRQAKPSDEQAQWAASDKADTPDQGPSSSTSQLQFVDSAELESQLREGVLLAESVFGPDDIRTGKAINGLAEYYHRVGRDKDAVITLDPIVQKAGFLDAAEVSWYAEECEELGEKDKAQRARNMLPELAVKDAKDHLLLALIIRDATKLYESLANVAYQYYKAGDQRRAEELFDFTIKQIENAHGAGSAMLYQVLPTYSKYLKETGRDDPWVDRMMKHYQSGGTSMDGANNKPLNGPGNTGSNLLPPTADGSTQPNESASSANDMALGHRQLLEGHQQISTDQTDKDGAATDTSGSQTVRVAAPTEDTSGSQSEKDAAGADASDSKTAPEITLLGQVRKPYSLQGEQERLNNLVISQLVFGPEGYETAVLLGDLGEYVSDNDTAQGTRSEAYFAHALQILGNDLQLQPSECEVFVRVSQAYAKSLRTHDRAAEADAIEQRSASVHAEENAKDEISVLASVFGGVTAVTASALVGLALVDETNGKVSESARLAREAVTMMDRQQWPEETATAAFMQRYADYLSADGDQAQAAQWKQKAADLSQRLASK